MPAAEPSLARLSNPLLRYLLATRPAFLSVTLFAVLIGLASAWVDTVRLAPASAVATMLDPGAGGSSSAGAGDCAVARSVHSELRPPIVENTPLQ